MAVAATVAAGAGLVSSPAGQQAADVMAQQATQKTQVVQQQQRTRTQARVSQQSAQQSQQRVMTSSQAVYLPWNDDHAVYGKFSMSPKEYGEYLMRSGKDKYNKRCRKHWAKALA